MSSMMDLSSALGGAGAGPGAGPGGPPPGPPPGPPAAVDDTGGATATGETYSNSMEALDGAEEALHAFIQLDPDEADRATAAKALQVVLSLKASNQSSAQSGDLKSLSRALLANGQQPGGLPGAGGAPGGY